MQLSLDVECHDTLTSISWSVFLVPCVHPAVLRCIGSPMLAFKESWVDINGVPELNESWAFDDNDWMSWAKPGLRRVKDLKCLWVASAKATFPSKFHRVRVVFLSIRYYCCITYGKARSVSSSRADKGPFSGG